MQKHVKRIIFLLCFMMLLTTVLSACASKKSSGNKGQYTRPTGDGRESTPDSLPDDLDFKGYGYNVFYRAGEWINYYECEGFNDAGASSVYVAVYERNERVCARLNCDIEWIPSKSGGLSETKGEISNIILKRDFYDFILSTNNTSLMTGLNAGLCDLRDAEYIDYDQPWWWNNVIDELAFDGVTINFLVGDMNLVNFQKMSAMYFNYDLIERMLQMTAKDLYTLVDDKEWTIDRFYYLTKKCYKDTANDPSGTGVKDDGDIYGFQWIGGESGEQFIYSTKLLNTLYKRLGNGLVSLTLEGNETAESTISALQELFHNNAGARDKTGSGGYDSKMIKDFANGYYVFLAQRLTAACTDDLREMDTDYGIIPYPLLEEGDDYVSWIQTSSTSMFIPGIVEATDGAFDRSCILLEALCSEAYRYTSVAFFESALKNKYTRDDNAAKMIDIIYESASKNFLVEYSTCANGAPGQLYQALYNNDSISRRFASTAGAGQTAINDFIGKTLAQYS